MVLIHMGWASPREIALCREFDLKISCTPSTSYRLGVGDMRFGHFPELLELGVTVSLSSNSAMSSNFLDLVRVMNLGAGGLKATRLDPTIMRPETMVEMATINGARAALWDDEIGSLEVGKKADVALFDTRKPEWCPTLNPLSNLVYASRGGAHTVIVDGRVVLDAGRVTTLDQAALLREVQRRGEEIAEGSGLAVVARPRWPVVA
jgi:5-methylthioadenosine/S-adenosylhomocysteine deaminase